MQATLHAEYKDYIDRNEYIIPLTKSEYENQQNRIANQSTYALCINKIFDYAESLVDDEKKDKLLIGRIFVLNPSVGDSKEARLILTTSFAITVCVCVFFYPQSFVQFSAFSLRLASGLMNFTNLAK